jgi:hypothetical protein
MKNYERLPVVINNFAALKPCFKFWTVYPRKFFGSNNSNKNIFILGTVNYD